MIHKNGIKDNRIVGSTGAIPYIENLPDEAIKRFQAQITISEMIGTKTKVLSSQGSRNLQQKIREPLKANP